MKRLTISIGDEVLHKVRKTQSEIQANESLNLSLSRVIETCCDVALAQNKAEVKKIIHKLLDRP